MEGDPAAELDDSDDENAAAELLRMVLPLARDIEEEVPAVELAGSVLH